MCFVRCRLAAYDPCIVYWVAPNRLVYLFRIVFWLVFAQSIHHLSREFCASNQVVTKVGISYLLSVFKSMEPVAVWKPHDPSALPTPEEKRLNDGALHILSSQLFAARKLVYDAEELLRQRRAEVDRIEYEIALRRNYVASVRALPSEILAEIGMIVAMRSDRYHWKAIWVFSWTCRAWRNALMAHPKVWGARMIIPECQNQFALVITARNHARGSHIWLSAHIGPHIHPIDVTAILQYRPKQITTLHLSTAGNPWLMFSKTKALPNLRRISLCDDTSTGDTRQDYPELLNALVPRKNCRASATKLHDIFLGGIVTGNPRVFARLSSLHLVSCGLPPVERFVHGISGSSDTLEALTLHRCRWLWSSVSVPTPNPVDFPRLCNLRTSGTPQAELVRLIRPPALELFEAEVFDDIWDDPLSKLEFLPPVLPVFGLVVPRGWSQFFLMQYSLQLCLRRCTKLRIYGDWRSQSGIDECCEMIKKNPLAFGDTITNIEIACHKTTSEQFSVEHLSTIKTAFDNVGRDISIKAFIWNPHPLNDAPWGTFAVSLICIFIDADGRRSLGNGTDSTSKLRSRPVKHHFYVAPLR